MIPLLNGKPGRCFASVTASFILLPSVVGFFNKNLVMDLSSSDKTSSEGDARRVSAGSANQYDHERAVADGGNVNYDVYKIDTEITKGGSKIENGANRAAATWMGKPEGRLSGGEGVKGFYVDKAPAELWCYVSKSLSRRSKSSRILKIRSALCVASSKTSIRTIQR
jgi:hypothetical protein